MYVTTTLKPKNDVVRNMNIPQLLNFIFFFFFFFLLTTPSSFSSGPISKPGCPDRCGNLSIPFPFGVGSECSLGEAFNITCNTSTNTAHLSSLRHGAVVEIKQTQIRVSFRRLLDAACYNKSGGQVNGTGIGKHVFDFSHKPYSFSDDNWLTAIGCDDLLTTFTYSLVPGEDVGSSCVSYCNVNNISSSTGIGFCPDNEIAYSPGYGCCVAPIPRGINFLLAKLTNLANEWRYGNPKLFSCSYAFIQEKISPNRSKFLYPLSYLNDPNEFLENTWIWKTRAPPIVRLDWRINGAENCSRARKNETSYVCRNNSVCVDFDASSIGGYLCRCKQGYEGNPYLTGPGGCQDIDECADSRTNPCDLNSICINNPGSVSCSCPKGYHGDGKRNGKGCIPSRIVNISIGVGSGLGLVLLLSICFLLRKAHQKRMNKKLKQKFFKQNGGLLLHQRTNEGTIGEPKVFHVEELEKATDNFNESRILGQGGQGIVYKGMLSNGKIVAIKKSKLVNKDQLDQFINEVMILSQINHRNVVKLLGCCLEVEVPLLVYEFLPNGTLFDLLHDPKIEFPISWNMRLKIAADVAGALAYLHSALSMPIYHRDIKSSNILLDEKYVVKVSDFGISRALAEDRTHLTTRVKGTFGYFDPEYFQSNQFTEKSDVYSFGVVLVELLTGQKPISSEREVEGRSLVTRFLAAIEDGNVDAILDPQVSEQGGKEEVIAVVLLARRCLNLQGKMRPTMKEVATELESLRFSQMPTNVAHEYCEEARDHYEAKSMMGSDTWTASDLSEVPSSSEIYPLKFGTV